MQRNPASAPQEPLIRIADVSKSFGAFTAVDGVSLDIAQGELFALLGGSGCGKTTLLRMLAGFEAPTSGRILIDGQDMAGIPPYERPVNMMFQSYALFPHMTVEANVGYGLKHEAMTAEQRRARVAEMLDLVRAWRDGMNDLRLRAQKLMQLITAPTMPSRAEVPAGSGGVETAILETLEQWRDTAGAEDCPLPELYRRAGQVHASLTIGRFHDALRALRERDGIYLHPWTGPLYSLPEPALALLSGHEIAYYASLKPETQAIRAKASTPKTTPAEVGRPTC